MKTLKEFRNLLIIIPLMGLLAACASNEETVGEYIDDSTITAKVKAAIIDDPALRTFDISVETYRNVVQLSGFVSTQFEKDEAGKVASDIKGVKKVKNNLIIRSKRYK